METTRQGNQRKKTADATRDKDTKEHSYQQKAVLKRKVFRPVLKEPSGSSIHKDPQLAAAEAVANLPGVQTGIKQIKYLALHLHYNWVIQQMLPSRVTHS